MADLVVSVPSKRNSAWSVETNPKYARAWLASLSPAASADFARELYQGLYTLNRMDLAVGRRLDLMALYQEPVQEAVRSLNTAFHLATFPMTGRLRRLAEFICQLHLEMAQGYKLCVRDLPRLWSPRGWRHQLAPAIERSLYYIGEVLLRSYELYLPYPPGIWRDQYILYDIAERHGRHEESVSIEEKQTGVVAITVSQRMRRLSMLGVANPYQMPFGECALAYRFLSHWIAQVRIERASPHATGAAIFLVDPAIDAPPSALGRAPTDRKNTGLYVLDAGELVRSLHVLLHQLERGGSAGKLQLGIECIDSACHDMLQRLHRAYAQTAARRHSRIKRHESVFVCAGLSALHFFAGDQKLPPTDFVTEDAPFTVPEIPGDADADEIYVALDEPSKEQTARRTLPPAESFRIDRWQVRDVSPQGLLLVQDGKPSVKFRVGDALGIQRLNIKGRWSAGIVRWFKAQADRGVEAGVELIAPDVSAASFRALADNSDAATIPVLALRAVEATHKPASFLAPRGVLQVGKDFSLTEANGSTRRVRVLDVLERTGSVERVVVGDVLQ